MPLNQAMILTKAVCMWESLYVFKNKHGETVKENVFNLHKENLVMLRENIDVSITSEFRVNCKYHHRRLLRSLYDPC